MSTRRGRIRNGLPEDDGKTVLKANQPIIEMLKLAAHCMAWKKIEHTYPHCWRCHNPMIFRATEQWFIGMEAQGGGQHLRQRALEAIKTVKWIPAWGEERISNMIATRPDWCISRQRVWGVPIIVFYCEALRQAADRSKRSIAGGRAVRASSRRHLVHARRGEMLARRNQVRAVRRHRRSAKRTTFSTCGSIPARAISPCCRELGPALARRHVSGRRRSVSRLVPQFAAVRVGVAGRAPYRRRRPTAGRSIAQGRAMSKSLGNGIDPVKIAGNLGAEVIRMWVASVDFQEDVTVSQDLMDRVAKTYTKLRNTFRYFVSNLYDFEPEKDALPFNQLHPLDQYMLLRTAEISELQKWLRALSFTVSSTG